jgi:hypothetical protein
MVLYYIKSNLNRLWNFWLKKKRRRRRWTTAIVFWILNKKCNNESYISTSPIFFWGGGEIVLSLSEFHEMRTICSSRWNSIKSFVNGKLCRQKVAIVCWALQMRHNTRPRKNVTDLRLFSWLRVFNLHFSVCVVDVHRSIQSFIRIIERKIQMIQSNIRARHVNPSFHI